jgi:membrane protein YqaA with SNARE-associated domain
MRLKELQHRASGVLAVDMLKVWFLYTIREISNAGGSLLGSEIWVREILLFVGAVVGAVWGYFLGKSAEHRRWRTQLRPGLEDLERAVRGSLSQNSSHLLPR